MDAPPSLLTIEHKSSHLRLFGTPKKFEFASYSVPNPTVCENRTRILDTRKADSLSRPEFAKPLGSGSHSLWEEATGAVEWLADPARGQ